MKQKNDKQTKRPQGARDRILHTAHDLFYREGIRATGIDRIIATAGVTKVTFYRHFPSKNDLIRCLTPHHLQIAPHYAADSLIMQCSYVAWGCYLIPRIIQS